MMSSVCCGRFGEADAGSTFDGAGGTGLAGAMTGVLTGGETDVPVAG
jgi:hypothetical protein